MKRSTLFFAFAFAIISTGLSAQKLMTRSGMVKFYSEAPLENIEAINRQTSSVIDLEKKQFAFLVPIKGFVFEKALMQEHFNERYLESDRYPSGSFKGSIEGLEDVNLDEDGEYPVSFAGVMNIHGVDNNIEEKAVLKVKDGKITLESEFELKPADYKVEIPASKRENISETLEMTVKMDYEQK